MTAGAPPDQVVALLEHKSQQGKLPGFRREPSEGTTLSARLGVFGAPYDRDLVLRVEPAGSGSTIHMESRLRMRLPWTMIILTVVSFWPGVVLTDSLLSTWFPSWYPKAFWVTCAWYLPLCALAIPALWKQYKSSERASEEHLRETVAKLREWLGAR